eukprot:m.118243 g.118243  ORF g.118243 m.118243 type:complete len:204 (-) comp17200_c0_seq5:723-1334(-)
MPDHCVRETLKSIRDLVLPSLNLIEKSCVDVSRHGSPVAAVECRSFRVIAVRLVFQILVVLIMSFLSPHCYSLQTSVWLPVTHTAHCSMPNSCCVGVVHGAYDGCMSTQWSNLTSWDGVFHAALPKHREISERGLAVFWNPLNHTLADVPISLPMYYTGARVGDTVSWREQEGAAHPVVVTDKKTIELSLTLRALGVTYVVVE